MQLHLCMQLRMCIQLYRCMQLTKSATSQCDVHTHVDATARRHHAISRLPLITSICLLQVPRCWFQAVICKLCQHTGAGHLCAGLDNSSSPAYTSFSQGLLSDVASKLGVRASQVSLKSLAVPTTSSRQLLSVEVTCQSPSCTCGHVLKSLDCLRMSLINLMV